MKTYIRALGLVLILGGAIAGLGFFSTTGDLAFDQSRLARIDAHYQKAIEAEQVAGARALICLLYTSPSPRDGLLSRMPSSA